MPTLIYRIVHRENLPWLLRQGVTCPNHPNVDPNHLSIGNRDLIGMREHRKVPIAPHGTLNDYVPFYFCTHSVMLFNIHTGRVEGVTARQSDIVYLVSSIERLLETNVRFVFTNQHAYVEAGTEFYADPAELTKLDWPLIRGRDFKRDPSDLGKLERRAAECLVYKVLPVDALLGIGCRDESTRQVLMRYAADASIDTTIATRPQWCF